MSIGTALFAQLATEGFARTQSRIAELQGRIASGKESPLPSDDPVRALRLSAAGEERDRLTRYSANATRAADRLALADTAMAEAGSILSRLQEMAQRLANDLLPEEGVTALRQEALLLRDALLSTANGRDAAGQPLFSGYGNATPFVDGPGGVVFAGDGGRPALALSEELTLATSLNGAEVFGAEGRGAFAAVDAMIAALAGSRFLSPARIEAEKEALLTVNATPAEAQVAFTLDGPLGGARIEVPMVAGVPGPMIEAINAQYGVTGVRAELAEDGRQIRLWAEGEIAVSRASRSDDPQAAPIALRGLQGEAADRGLQRLMPEGLTHAAVLDGLNAARRSITEGRAEVGALAAQADRQTARLADRSLRLDLALSSLQDLDIARAVTDLQTLLMTQEAAQQSFVRIRSSGLFDYLR